MPPEPDMPNTVQVQDEGDVEEVVVDVSDDAPQKREWLMNMANWFFFFFVVQFQL